MANISLAVSKAAKNDEFYTQLPDIEKELAVYKEQFYGQVVFCNCDDPQQSNFYKFFATNFHDFKLKKLICTCYKNNDLEKISRGRSEKAVALVYTGKGTPGEMPEDGEYEIIDLVGDGDFRSEECVEFLKESDIVVTNPPFSLFREYFAQLINYDKKFLVIGNKNAITYKEVFPYIKADKVRLGTNSVKSFERPDGQIQVFGNIGWLTNLVVPRRHELLELTKTYYGNESEYPTYDNCDGIEVSRVANIPSDYMGLMGVPITFLDKFNPEQFEIVRHRKGDNGKDLVYNGKLPYSRILIRRRA